MVIKLLLIILMISLTTIVVMQIVFRFIIKSPLSWSEELSRYIFIWLVYIGGYLTVRNNSNLGLTYFAERLPIRLRKFNNVLSIVIITLYMLIVGVAGIVLSVKVMSQPSAIMRIPMGIVYFAIPIGMFLMAIGMVASLYNTFKTGGKI